VGDRGRLALVCETGSVRCRGADRRGSAYSSIKRAVDAVVSFIVLLLCLPLFAAIAAAIKLDSAGTVLFLQDRVGWEGVPFRMLKFRSMRMDAEAGRAALRKENGNGPVFKLHDDPRVTRVGRFLRRTSLDELPQFINVLLGHMSLVGPRPLPKADTHDYDLLPPDLSPELVAEWLAVRQTVRPGISGLWQVNGRSLLTLQDWVRYDLEYARGQSLLMDLRVLVMTPVAVFLGRGAV
jgi:lipopolysaccharide/colanic/teichoic acid biosynthesis glycosyltransferase